MSTDESCLKIIPSYEVGKAADKFGTISCGPSGVKHATKVKIARTDGENVEQIVNECFAPVLKAASNATTADKDACNFVYQLMDTGIYETFKGAADSLGINVDNPKQGDFLKIVKKFLAEVTTCEHMQDNILRYLECSVKKPREMEPHRFWLRFSTLLQQSKYFDGIKPYPSQKEIIDWYFRAFPIKYRLNYKASHGNNKPDAATVTKHMTLCHQMDVADGAFKKKPSTKDKSVTKDEKGRDRRRRDKDKSRTFNRDQVKIRDDGPCPVHPNGNHTWGECSMNPKNKDDKKRDHRSTKDKDDKKKKESKGGHSHHVQQDESENEKEDGQESESDSDSSEENSNKRMRTASNHVESEDVSNDMDSLAVADTLFADEED